MKARTQTGFSLLELLVVISIIGILAAVSIGSLSDSRDTARDTKRLADMDAIEQALFLYYQANGNYPGPTNAGVPAAGQIIGAGLQIDTALAPYLSEVPKDPRYDSDPATYFYSYDPEHIVHTTNCSGTPPADANLGVVFGFNRSEVGNIDKKDTCHDNEQNLDQADYNRALFPASN